MALTQSELLTGVAVLVVLFAIIVWNNVAAMKARRGATAGRAPAPDMAPATSAFHPAMAKFARHEGSVVGEGVAIDGDRLILKQAGVFKAVPLAQAEVKGDDVVLTGSIDWAAAESAGAAWHAAHRAAAVPEVSGVLTRSEDVKAPAMDAVREREGR